MSCDPNPPRRRRYRSDLSDTTWTRIARFTGADHPHRARPCRPQRWREYLDAILYVLHTRRAWRHLPHDFAVKWSAAHKHFLRWCRAGTWAKVLSGTRRGPHPLRPPPPAHGGRGGLILG
jgi:transposase